MSTVSASPAREPVRVDQFDDPKKRWKFGTAPCGTLLRTFRFELIANRLPGTRFPSPRAAWFQGWQSELTSAIVGARPLDVARTMKQNITRCIGRFVCVTALALSACNRQSPSSTQAPASSDAPQGRSLASGSSCGDLAKLSLPNTTITAADDIAVGAFVPPAGAFSPPAPPGAPTPYAGLPPFCRVSGTIAPVPGSEIHFEVWLPKTWNGKFVGVGNGGAAGLIFYPFMAEPLTRGYAVAATDAGHSGGLGDWSFAVHREKLIDFGYRAIHEMTEKSKAVVEAHYGTTANRSVLERVLAGRPARPRGGASVP